MANNYLEFSQVLPHLTAEEEQWLERQLETVYVFAGQEHDEESLPEDRYPEDADWHGCRAYRDVPECAQYVREIDLGGPGFEFHFQTDRDQGGWGRHLWVHAGEGGYLQGLAILAQKFFKQFRPQQCWSLTYADTCSKPRVGEFGGGAMFVTAWEIRWQDAYDFVEQQRALFTVRKATEGGPTTLEELAELVGKAQQESRLGKDTCVYCCLPEREYVPVKDAVLDQDASGAVFLLMTGP